VLERCGLPQAIEGADLVITGEGRLDRQTLMGKGPGCVIGMAREHGVPVAAICGTIEDGFDPAAAGLVAAIAVSDGLPQDLAMDPAGTLMRVQQAVTRIVTATQGETLQWDKGEPVFPL
jgi:glycerate kinase